jgi:hypothetical protein
MIELSVDQQSILGVVEALRYEDDSKQLRKDLLAGIKRAVEPALPEIRSGLMGMATAGLETEAPGLRTTVLRKLKIKATLSGAPKVRVSIGRTGMPRGFDLAARRLNSKKGWRHPVFGNRDVWVEQMGEPEYFDKPLRSRKEQMQQAVMGAVQEMRDRIRRRA